ncbi:hypothetical protein FR5810_02488 [Bordetella pertussis]|nr:Uncharacterised protein [Bordetella pertussis]CPO46999.1 Uncharacterised protein [Bordetella pertussis]VDL05609.1 hypothetical protein FR5810_02488 [Bordetella pertussis]
MNGTSADATAPMRRIPPSTTMPINTMVATPVAQSGMPKDVPSASAMLLTCTMLPMPKPARPPNSANNVPSHAHRGPSPLRMAYIGPPVNSPRASLSRKCTASSTSLYLVAMPTSAVTHIQNRAPGPPRKMAVATPAMLPVPTVAARLVISAWNGLISPVSASPLARLPQASRNPAAILASGMKRRRSMRNRPVPRISTSINGPQTRPLTLSTIESRKCITVSMG